MVRLAAHSATQLGKLWCLKCLSLLSPSRRQPRFSTRKPRMSGCARMAEGETAKKASAPGDRPKPCSIISGIVTGLWRRSWRY